MALPLPTEDGELVALARSGSDDAFGALYERYFTSVYDFLTRLLRDRQEAADAAQDTFIKAFERLGHLENPESFKSWLFTIAHRNGLNRIERSKRAVAVGDFNVSGREAAELGVIDLDRAGDPERSAEAQAAASLIWEAAAGLDPKTYAVMDLHVRQGFDSAEIAEVLGVSKGNAYTMVSRMKKSFSQTLSTYLLVRNGSADCEGLAAIVAESAGTAGGQAGGTQLTPALRKQVDRHAKSCEICQENRKILFIPIRMFAALAAVPAPAGLEAAIWGNVSAARIGGAGGSDPASTVAVPAAAAPSWLSANIGALAAAAVLIAVLVVTGIALFGNNSGDTEVLSGGLTADSTDPTVAGSSTSPPATISPTTEAPPVVSTTTASTVAPTTTLLASASVAVADSAQLTEDTSLVIDVLANDSDYAPGAAPEIATAPAHGSARVSRSSIWYAPAANYAGSDRLAYSVLGADGNRHTAQVTITVVGVNDAPVVPGPGSLTVGEDRPATFDPLEGAIDVDGDRLTVTSFDRASTSGGSITAGSIVYHPPKNWAGLDTFSYVVSDGTVEIAVDVVVKVTPVNDAPSGPSPVLAAIEDGTAVGNILDGWSDVEGDIVVIADPGSRTTDQGGSATVDALGAVVYTAPVDFSGTDSFRVKITDGAATVAVDVVVEVAATNDPPVVASLSLTVSEGTPVGEVIGVVVATDPDGDEIHFEAVAPSVVEVRADGSVVLVARLDFEAATAHRLDARAIDEAGAATPFSVSVAVTDVDEAPRINDATFRVTPNAPAGTVVGTVVGADPEGLAVTYRLRNAQGLVAVDRLSGVLRLTAEANPAVFPIVMRVFVADPAGHETRATVTLLLQDIDAPVISNFAADVDAFYEPPLGGGVCDTRPRMATFTADITDDSGVRGADLHWRITVVGEEITGIVKMLLVEGRWTADLTAPPGILIDGKSATIYSRIRARDDFGHFTVSTEIGVTLLPCQRL